MKALRCIIFQISDMLSSTLLSHTKDLRTRIKYDKIMLSSDFQILKTGSSNLSIKQILALVSLQKDKLGALFSFIIITH